MIIFRRLISLFLTKTPTTETLKTGLIKRKSTVQIETISAAAFTHHLVNTQIIHIHIKALISILGSFRTTVAQCNAFKSVSLPFSEFRKAQ